MNVAPARGRIVTNSRAPRAQKAQPQASPESDMQSGSQGRAIDHCSFSRPPGVSSQPLRRVRVDPPVEGAGGNAGGGGESGGAVAAGRGAPGRRDHGEKKVGVGSVASEGDESQVGGCGAVGFEEPVRQGDRDVGPLARGIFEARVEPAGIRGRGSRNARRRDQRGSDAHVQGGRPSGGERALGDRLDERTPDDSIWPHCQSRAAGSIARNTIDAAKRSGAARRRARD